MTGTSTLLLILTTLLHSISSQTVDDQRFKCYTCYKCPQPFDKASSRVHQSDGCMACATMQLYRQDRLIRTTRTCLGHCLAKNVSIDGFVFAKQCCRGDLCNSARDERASLCYLFLTILVLVANSNLG